jgi:hypothetical protein
MNRRDTLKLAPAVLVAPALPPAAAGATAHLEAELATAHRQVGGLLADHAVLETDLDDALAEGVTLRAELGDALADVAYLEAEIGRLHLDLHDFRDNRPCACSVGHWCVAFDYTGSEVVARLACVGTDGRRSCGRVGPTITPAEANRLASARDRADRLLGHAA